MEMGGYFGLDMPDHGDAFPYTIKFQSGRAALRALLQGAGIEKIFLPAYICDSVIQSVIDAGAVAETYELDDSLYPAGLTDAFPEKSALLYVNYFGLCEANVFRLLHAFPNKQLIIDNSQALLARPTRALASIYSPRKFVGVPDGGLLVAPELRLEEPEQEDAGSLGRMKHLLIRMASAAQDGYHDYLEAERSLGDTTPLRMSQLTQRILASVDMAVVANKRRENFSVLAGCLDKWNLHKWILDSGSVPLCYPLLVDGDVQQIKKTLVQKNIYIPTYWQEARSRVAEGIEHRLINSCLAVPCDQRYSPDQMLDLANEIIQIIDR